MSKKPIRDELIAKMGSNTVLRTLCINRDVYSDFLNQRVKEINVVDTVKKMKFDICYFDYDNEIFMEIIRQFKNGRYKKCTERFSTTIENLNEKGLETMLISLCFYYLDAFILTRSEVENELY